MAEAFKEGSGLKQSTQNAPSQLRAGKPREWYEKLMMDEPKFERKGAPGVKKERMRQKDLGTLVSFFSQATAGGEQIAAFNKINGYELAPDDLRAILEASAENHMLLVQKALEIAKTDILYGSSKLSRENITAVLGEAIEYNHTRKDAIGCIIADIRNEEPRLGAECAAELIIKALSKPGDNTPMAIECIRMDLKRKKPQLDAKDVLRILMRAAGGRDTDRALIFECIREDLGRKKPRLAAWVCTEILKEAIVRGGVKCLPEIMNIRTVFRPEDLTGIMRTAWKITKKTFHPIKETRNLMKLGDWTRMRHNVAVIIANGFSFLGGLGVAGVTYAAVMMNDASRGLVAVILSVPFGVAGYFLCMGTAGFLANLPETTLNFARFAYAYVCYSKKIGNVYDNKEAAS